MKSPRRLLILVLLLLLAIWLLPVTTIGQGSEHATQEPVLDRPLSALEKTVLSLLDPDQIQAFIDGTPPEFLYLDDGRTLAELLAMYGELLPDCSDPSAIFCDGFETGNPAAWGEVLGLRSPAVTVQSSPADGEADVAVTRETILHFSAPLPAGTVIDESMLFAEFGGQDIPARIHLSPARDRVTLFYDQGLPASARIRVRLVGDSLLDANGNGVDADGDGEYGGTAEIDFDTLSLTTVPGTRVCGSVFASELLTGEAGSPMDQPLNGVAITVDGQESVLFTHTDSMGNFCLDPAPAGRFFVHIDGRTATNQVPTGAYYPFVGKAWDSVVGQEINIGTVYLPLVVDGTLQPTSMEEETEVELADTVLEDFPELEGTMLMVPPDSLYSDDGTRGGMVGIAPVAPDRLPGTLPEGLNFPLVITVQTDGATNFDTPAPICFPNLPDPTTGEPLQPGQKSALWSFNHDTGRFEVKGPMTVTADGTLVCTDPGVGVEAPGWHGTQPGTQLEGDADNEPDDQDPCADPAHRRLLDHLDPSMYPQAVQDALAAIDGAEFQLANDPSTAAFTDLTFDEYSVVIRDNEFPTGYTPQDFVREFLRGPNEALNSGGFNVVNQFTWQGTGREAQLGDVYDIDIFGPDNGSVMLTALNDLSWQFSIIDTDTHGQHPLYGAREFGFEPLANGDWKFYTKGFSKPANTLYNAGIPLKDTGWLALMTGLPVKLFRDRTGSPPTLPQLQDLFMSHPPTQNSYGLPEVPACAGGNWTPGPEDRPEYLYKGSDSELFFYRLEYADLDSVDTVRVLQGNTSNQGYLSSILPAGVIYNLYIYNPDSGLYGFASGQAAIFGVTDVGTLHVDLPVGPDADGDGLGAIAEFIVGTNADVADSDADGTLDGAEINQGTDPLDGLPVATGILASVDTPGQAVDVCASDNVAVVADSNAGVSVLNVFNDLNPTIVAQVDTPGNALAVTCSTERVVVADGTAGLAVVDVSDPPAAFIAHQVPLSGSAQAVQVAGNLAFVGTDSGQIAVVELGSGSLLQALNLSREIQDIAISGEVLYALTTEAIHVMPLLQGDLRITASVDFLGGVGAGGRRLRLFAGGPVLYATHTSGVDTYDLSDPLHPLLIARGDTDQFGWKHLVTNGSGLGIATVSPNSTNDGPHHVSIYDVRDPSQTDLFLAQFETPGLAAAVSVFNGLAYVADSGSGLQVLSYLAYDNLGIPPTIDLQTNFSEGQAEEGKIMRLTAEVDDDVQVRHVEFFVDGEPVSRDGNFPFEYRFVTPLISEQATFTIRARATDTGGNTAETEETVITLTPDATPPQVVATSPGAGATEQPETIQVVSATFSEPIDSTQLDDSTFTLAEAGADGLPGTADDVPVVGAVTYEPEARTAFLTFASTLDLGTYRATLDAVLRDLSGNPLSGAVEWDFSVVDGTISSLPGGGDWSDPATWNKGRLPNASDLVSIRGPVTLDVNATVSALTVGPGASLQEGPTTRTLNVTDRTVNHGSLTGSRLNLRSLGDLVNNGVWTADLELDGFGSRTISGAVPIDGAVTLYGNGVEITQDALLTGPVDLNFSTLTLNAPTTVTFGGIESTGIISGGGTLGLTGSFDLESNAVVDGNVIVQPGSLIENREDVGRVLSVSGDFTNLGTLRNHPGGGSLTVEVGGDIVNEGSWTADLDLIGTDPRSINGAVPIAAAVELRDSFEITGDAVFTGPLDLNFFTLTLNAPTVVTFGGVRSTGTILGGGALGLAGSFDMQSNAYIDGNVILQPGALIQNREDLGRVLTVTGDFTNSGTLQDHPGGGSLTVEVGGSIVNEGPWTADLDMIGTDPRTITGAVPIAAAVELRDSFEITGDALFTGPLDLNFFTLTLNAPTIVTFGGVESTGTILGGGTLGLAGSIDMESNAYVDGNVRVQPGTLIQNQEIFARSFSVVGNFDNFGTIQDHPGGGSLTVEVGGSIVNEGPWTADLDMIGTDPRTITGAVPIAAAVELRDSFEITNDAVLAGPIDLNFFSLTLNAPRKVTFGGVSGTGTIIGGGTLRLAGAVIDTADAYLTGNLEVAVGAVLQNQMLFARRISVSGDFTNHGTVQDHAGSGSLTVEVGGSIVNEGPWTAHLEMIGTDPRSITGAVPIAADMELQGSFEITNDAVLAGPLDLNFFSLTLNAPRKVTFGGVEGTGTIIGGGTLRLAGALIDMMGSAYITGKVEVAAGTILQNEEGFARRLDVEGDLTNFGNIRHHPNSGSLRISATGTLDNQGTITATIDP